MCTALVCFVSVARMALGRHARSLGFGSTPLGLTPHHHQRRVAVHLRDLLRLLLLLLLPADSDDLILASTNFTVDSTGSQEVEVQLGMLGVEASFDQLAWAGMYYPRPRQSTSTIIIHAIIVGAQVRAR